MSGDELRARRRALGLTQRQLGDALGIPQPTIARWESGRHAIEHGTLLDLALAGVARSLPEPRRRIPLSPFEVNLFRRFLQGQFAGWERLDSPHRGAVGTYQGDGTWLLTVEPVRPFSWEHFFGPQIAGRCWVEADDRDDPVAHWSVPATEYGGAQTDRIDGGPPVASWDLP